MPSAVSPANRTGPPLAARMPALPPALLLALAAVPLVTISPGSAQETVQSETARVVPVEQEPRHHLVFSTPYVRVLDVVLPHGYTTLFHEHAKDNIPIAVVGGSLLVQSAGGEPHPVVAESGSVTFAAGGFVHRITNQGTSDVHYVDVELREVPPPLNSAVAELDPSHHLEIDNARVRVFRVTLEPGQQVPPHLHAGAVVLVYLSTAKVSPWPESPPDETTDETTPRPRRVRRGEYRWLLRGNVPATAAGSHGTELIEIEFKPGAQGH